MGSLTISLLGTSFKINAQEEDQYLQQLLNYYTDVIEKLQSSLPNQGPLQTAILAGIMLTDELYSHKNSTVPSVISAEHTQIFSHVENVTKKLIDSIDQVL